MNYPLTTLLVDMDSYFASVEQHLTPSLRGKPIAVAPVLVGSSCCIAASYEAKAYGVKTGTGIKEARSLCPSIQFVQARPKIYTEIHHEIVNIVESCIHVEQVLSIDEMACTLPLNLRDRNTVREIGLQIKARLQEKLSPYIKCSIGAGPNAWLAKIASNTEKPNGLTIWEDGRDLPNALFNLSLRNLHGIGSRMEARLHSHGIHTVQKLYEQPEAVLRRIWGGVGGARIWHKLRGVTIEESKPSQKRSIGHSHVLSPELRPPEKALHVLHRLVQKAAARMRGHKLLAGSMSIHIRYQNRDKWKSEAQFAETSDSIYFSRLTQKLWETRLTPTAPILKLGVNFHQLVSSENYTPSLFTQKENKRAKLNNSIDKIVNKYGKNALYIANSHYAQEAAPTRIAFTHIPAFKQTKTDPPN